jgi:hypothetical protein
LAGATDYDNTTPATDRQAILWVASGSSFKPQTIQLADVSGLVPGLAGKQPLDADLTTIAGLTVVNDSVLQGKAGGWAVRTPAQLKTDLVLAKGDVGLGNVDNTADTAKPVSTAQQTALDLKAPLASPAFTGTPTGITKTHVGLPNVDNTTDLNKPVSTATQTALDGKQPLDADLTTIAALTATTDNFMQAKAGAWASRTLAQVRTDLALQPLDADLTTIAALTATTDSFMQAKAGAWSARTVAQVKTDLAITGVNIEYYQASLQTITTSTQTKVKFDTATRSHADITVSGTGNVDFTFNRAGTWAVTASLGYVSTSASDYYGFLILATGGPIRLASASVTSSTGLTPVLNLAATQHFAVNDVISVQALHFAGANRDMYRTERTTRITITWVSDA